jgi:hypothetical protein
MAAKKITGKQWNFPYDLPSFFVLALSDRRPSSYVLEANGATDGESVPIDCARGKKVKRISSVMVYNTRTDQWDVKQTRFIRGCPTIWVEEQEKNGYKSANPAQDGIWIESGDLQFAVEGHNIQKAMFLMLHENNGSFGGDDRYRRPEGSQTVFFHIDNERDADDMVGDFDLKLKADQYLSRLKRPGKEGGQFEYNTDLLEFLHNLFELPAPAQVGKYGSETFVQLIGKANSDPKEFLKKIGDSEATVESDMNKAIAAKVISFDEVGAILVPNSKVLVSFSGQRLSLQEQKAQLLDYLLNPQNRTVYDHIRRLTTNALVDETSLVS